MRPINYRITRNDSLKENHIPRVGTLRFDLPLKFVTIHHIKIIFSCKLS